MQRLEHACLASRRQSVEVWATDRAGRCAQRERFDDLIATPHTTIDDQFEVAANGITYGW